MAAQEKFENFNAMLSVKDSDQVKDLIASTRNELFAARSEDERVRLVDGYIRGVREEILRKR